MTRYLLSQPESARSGQVVCFFQAWSNWRRTGYPGLDSQAPGVEIPTRMQDPVDAVTKNTANVNEAIERQGPDDFWTKVWWDK